MTPSGPAHANGRKPAGKGTHRRSQSHSNKSSFTKTDSQKNMTCFNCGGKGHSQVQCKKNMSKCKLCGGKGHMFSDCPQYRPPAAKGLSFETVRGAQVFSNKSTRILISCTRLGSTPLMNVLLDTGAEFSAISKRLIEKYHIIPTPVPKHEEQVLAGAAQGMKVARIGTVTLPVTVTYPLSGHDASVSFTKKFEVMDIAEDVLLGVEVWPTLFPNFEGVDCLCQPSSITQRPTQIKYHKAARIYRVVPTQPIKLSDKDEADVCDQVSEYDLLELGSTDLDVEEVNRIFAMHSLTDTQSTSDTQSSSSSSSSSTSSSSSSSSSSSLESILLPSEWRNSHCVPTKLALAKYGKLDVPVPPNEIDRIGHSFGRKILVPISEKGHNTPKMYTLSMVNDHQADRKEHNEPPCVCGLCTLVANNPTMYDPQTVLKEERDLQAENGLLQARAGTVRSAYADEAPANCIICDVAVHKETDCPLYEPPPFIPNYLELWTPVRSRTIVDGMHSGVAFKTN